MVAKEMSPVRAVHNNVYINVLPPRTHEFSMGAAKDSPAAFFHYAVLPCGWLGVPILTIGLAGICPVCAFAVLFPCGCICAL